MNTTVTIEHVAHQFQIWRQNKTSKFDPIPTHLKDLITQLLPHYRQQTIMRQLNISSTTLSSIKKSHGLNHKKSDTKLRTLHKANPTNTRTKSKSSLASESKISFLPFQLTTPPALTTSNASVTDSPTFEASSSQPSNCATCHITKTDGSTLIIKTSDPKSVIQAFLCSN